MQNYNNFIDTDMAIGTILSNFETPWIMNSVQDSLNMRFRPFNEPMPNFVDILSRQFATLDATSGDYREQVANVRDDTYKEIITCICNYYNLSFNTPFDDLSPQELFGVAHTMYDIFISRFTLYMIDFFTQYIVTNKDSIYNYLIADDSIKKPKEKDTPIRNYIDPKFQLIHANVNMIIMNMAAYDISLETLLDFFLDPMGSLRLKQLLSDNGDIFKNYYAIYLQDQRYMADLLTSIKLRLQARTQEVIQQYTEPN